jgi:uridine kinase
MRIVRLHLDDQGAHITGVSTLDANNPYFEIPTTGVVAKDDYYVIANSQLPDLDQSVNQIIDSTRLSDTYLLKYNLKNR